MAGGWMTGLGQGLQNVGNVVSDYSKQRMIMQQQALENALKQQQFEESKQDRLDTKSWRESQMKMDAERAGRERAKFQADIFSELPDNTELSEDQLSNIDPLVRTAFTKQAQNLPTSQRFGADTGQGPSIMGGEAGASRPGEYRSIPPMTMQQKVAEIRAQTTANELARKQAKDLADQNYRGSYLSARQADSDRTFQAQMAARSAQIAQLQATISAGNNDRDLRAQLARMQAETNALNQAWKVVSSNPLNTMNPNLDLTKMAMDEAERILKESSPIVPIMTPAPDSANTAEVHEKPRSTSQTEMKRINGKWTRVPVSR
jgi:hypothetical protein